MAGLAISTLNLSHFRNHLMMRMAFDGRPAAIIGPNGAGKTNILEAISLLSPGRGLRRAASDDFARKPQSLGWKITAEVSGFAAAHQVETWSEGSSPRQVRIDGKAAPQLALGRILRILWLVPAMDRLWIEAAEGRRAFLDRMAMSFFPSHGEAVLTYEKAMRERNRLLKDQHRDPFWYNALEAKMAVAAEAMTQHRQATLTRIALAQEGAATAFPCATLSLLYPEAPPQDWAQSWAQGRSRDMAAGRTLQGPHRVDLHAIWADKGVAAAQCSTGEQKALLLSLVMANARALAADLGQAPILLLDEVSAHLDRDRRAALYDEVVALGAQAFMTGTEIDLFDTLGARAQVFNLMD